MAKRLQAMPTVGEIARRLNVPVHRVEYVLRTRSIQPTARAGNAWVYSEADVEAIASALRLGGEAASIQEVADVR